MQTSLVIHDNFKFPGGGERVAVTLARGFRAELWSASVQSENFPKSYFDGLEPKSLSLLDRIPFRVLPSDILQDWLLFAHFPKKKAKLTFFSGFLSPLAHKRIIGPKILYCHSPPRILYDKRNFYLEQCSMLKKPIWLSLLFLYKKAYERAIKDMDCVLANSQNVANRLRKYLNMQVQVVYPPCETKKFKHLGYGDYYLSTGRLDQLKRVDLIVKAFLKMRDKKLVVVSGGPYFKRIKQMANNADNITFLGWVGEKKLRSLIGNCIATIYIPMDEDFGISPVESMAAGKPVLGVKEGGILETVVDGKTGILLPPNPGIEDIIKGVKSLTPGLAAEMRSSCEERAELFSIDCFVKRVKAIAGKFTN
ncbi:glycosyltransferase [Desulfohalobiaceae bacterium Ax17]|uniref:glycosyltransferase n=1 Tax=Desulfovulcanus ferrireducens TaxID=2831190 RepID=UPI00207B9F79|nr:glycosyltransferase [Desulfovulcanus ferrireducens]MBT8764373.1 glycosyltransferase [Desulfovulcanus ferrireducens]